VQDLKISLITVTRNAERTLSRCIDSVIAQTYPNVEYIVVDGASTDGTLKVIDRYKQHIDLFVSEPDKGIYDAMNKGINAATGDIVGILNADDHFVYNDVLNNIAQTFEHKVTEAVYADLHYLDPKGKIIRKWNAGVYEPGLFNWGWMPPHPTFYCKRSLFEDLGQYDLNFGSAADYELMSRFIHLKGINVKYLNKVIVNMEIGGISNKNSQNRVKAWSFDYKAMRKNGIALPCISIMFKPLRKIFQYL
jgi:glycosyltransferase involved in cell wall biosynthesis